MVFCSSCCQSILNVLQNHIEKLEENILTHETYLTAAREASDWLRDVQHQLESCADVTGDKESLEEKLDTVNDLLASKEQGEEKFMLAKELGERLYPTTSKEGRELIRQELSELREQWDSFVDGLNDIHRRLEHTLALWSTYTENYDQVIQWVKDMEYRLTSDTKLKIDLHDKKTMLQNYRVSLAWFLYTDLKCR